MSHNGANGWVKWAVAGAVTASATAAAAAAAVTLIAMRRKNGAKNGSAAQVGALVEQDGSSNGDGRAPEIGADAVSLENQRLREENLRLQERVGQLEEQVAPEPLYRRLGRNWRGAGLTLLLIVLAVLPPIFVVIERWLGRSGFRDQYFHYWKNISFLNNTMLPSYFIVVFILLGIQAVLVLLRQKGNKEAFASQIQMASSDPAAPIISARQKRIATILQIVTAVGALAILTIGSLTERVPNLDLVAVLLAYLAGVILSNFPVEKIRGAWKHIPQWVLPYGVALLVWILFIRALAEDPKTAWLYAVLTLLVVAVGWKRIKATPWIMWLAAGVLWLYSLGISNWFFSGVGDEYNFFTYAREILLTQSGDWIISHLFSGQAVYSSHPYFSSLLQALSMKIFGMDNFGWRFSSIFFAVAALVFFYLFWRMFVSRTISAVAVVMLAFSAYLIQFPKIGYNNSQALFAMSLVLWLTGVCTRNRQAWAYSLLGLSMGLCLYVYPAAMYAIPLPFLLLLFFDPPRSRAAIGRWAIVVGAFFLLFMPLLFQEGYWAEKIPGTFLNRPDVVGKYGPAFHFGSNYLYGLFSYLYMPQETHFVASSYVDPLSAALLPFGFLWALRLYSRNRFAAFWVLAYLFMMFLVGATHDRVTPSNTRMFMMLPFFCLFVAMGVVWWAHWLKEQSFTRQASLTVITLLTVLGVGLGLYQAYVIVPARFTGISSLEVLFLRLMQRNEAPDMVSNRSYIFVTDADWGIDGLRDMREIYGVPRSQVSLGRVLMTGPELDDATRAWLAKPEVFAIVQPWINKDYVDALEAELYALGKKPCPVRETPFTDVRFVMWYSEDMQRYCPAGGHWE